MSEEARTTFLEELVREPRLSALPACGENLLISRVDVPDPRADRLNPTLVCHRRGPDGAWGPVWAARGTVAALVGPESVAYATGAEIRLRGPDAVERPLHRVDGRVVALLAGPDRLTCLVQETRAWSSRRPAALGGADVVWFADSSASLGGVRRAEGGWRIVRLDPTQSTEPRSFVPVLPAGANLTGEAAWLGDDLVLGTAYDLPEGRRRFGLITVDATGSVVREFRMADIDLTGLVASPEGRTLACLGTSVPVGDDHPVQFPCLIDTDWRCTPLDRGDDLWQQPRAWSGEGVLFCTAEDGPNRRLLRHDLRTGVREPVQVAGSVLDVVTHGSRTMVLTSALDALPSVQTIDSAGSTETVEPAGGPALPGRLRRLTLPDPATGIDFGGWLCTPDDRPPTGLVVVFHGGPLKSWTDWAWRWSPWPWVAAGYQVALLEPPMSLGYGNAGIAAGWRRWRTGIGAVAVEQVRAVLRLTGVPAPLAVMGGSFGGYLALITAAELAPRLVVTHGAPVDLRQTASVSDVGWQWIREYGDPDTRRSAYDEQSLPHDSVPAGTRVLVSHGLADDLVPASESVRLHRSLLRRAVRSELAIFPTEGHPLLRPRNLRAWFDWVLSALAAETPPDGDGGHTPAAGDLAGAFRG
ncbi:alpha/beta hydrolase family protein [Micromonospora sp. DT62]|uniref:alpha/beta hydrolase family protein n=1 Tax=Micromonospora sp. DT62 TaxID=3416521 RepID=UPI003CF43D20